MKTSSNFISNRSGWLDKSDPIYWEKMHTHRFKLLNNHDEDAVNESMSLPEEAFEGMSVYYPFFPGETVGIETISLYLNLPNEGFEQLHAMLRSQEKSLQEIKVHVGLEEAGSANKVQIELKFEACV